MILLLPLLLCSMADSARILGVFPLPSISHQVVFRALTIELAKRGHELVVITPDPILPTNQPKGNITEIPVTRMYDFFKKNLIQNPKVEMKRGVISGMDTMTSFEMIQSIFRVTAELLNFDEVNALLSDKTQKFDLVMVESFACYYYYIFAKIFNAPLIAVSSFYGLPEIFEVAGAVSRHPIHHPNLMRNKFKNLSFSETIAEIYNEYKIMRSYASIEEHENKFLKNKFGEDAPTISELKDLVSVVFLNSFPAFDNNRPVPPNVVYLGALQLQPIKELPKDLKEYLDNSKRGVVYVSLGTNVHPTLMDKDLLYAFVDAFRQIPYDILWKFDGILENVPDNVRIQKWFPQRDLLVHPNIKAFVTQGGLQSTDEAIDAGVPLVGIPFLGDQWFNVHKYEQLGIGVQLDAYTLTADDIVRGVKTVTSDEKYRQNMKKVKTIMYDTPQTPLERAVWWTEYVIRHKGAQHLKSPAANMSYREYYMVDFILCVIAALAIALSAVFLIVYYVISLFKPNNVKIKRN